MTQRFSNYVAAMFILVTAALPLAAGVSLNDSNVNPYTLEGEGAQARILSDGEV